MLGGYCKKPCNATSPRVFTGYATTKVGKVIELSQQLAAECICIYLCLHQGLITNGCSAFILTFGGVSGKEQRNRKDVLLCY